MRVARAVLRVHAHYGEEDASSTKAAHKISRGRVLVQE